MEIEKEQKFQLKSGKSFKLPIHEEILSGPTKNKIDPNALKDEELFSYEKPESKIQEVKMTDDEEETDEDESEDEDIEDEEDDSDDED